MNVFIRLYSCFDHQICAVENSKRFYAYLIDWFFGSLCTMLPMCLLWMFWTQNVDTMSDANILFIAGQIGDGQAYLAGLLCIVCAIFYYVIYPWKIHPGQTPGKRAMHFKIVRSNGCDVTLLTLLKRQILGIVLLESVLYSISGILFSMLTLATNINFIVIMRFIGLAIGMLSGFLIMKTASHRMLHDYLADTKVVLYDDTMTENERI